MLESTYQRLPDLLVRLLGAQPAQRADQLQSHLAALGHHYTIQAIYKELRRLQAAGVLLRHKTLYSLDLTWITNLDRFAERAKDVYLAPANAATVLPPLGAKTRWSFSSLVKLDDFWVQILWMMFLRSDDGRYYNWAPHPWFYFGQSKKLEQFYSALSSKGKEIYVVVGGRSAIDQLYRSKVDPQLFEVLLAPQTFPDKRHQHFGVIGDMTLVVTLERRMSRLVDAFFDQTKSAEHLNYDRIYKLLSMSTKATLQVEHNPIKAAKMRKLFQGIFAVTTPSTR